MTRWAAAEAAFAQGADADSGTCWECGYAFGQEIPVIAVRTDFRAGGDDPARPVNLMLSQGSSEFVRVETEGRNDISWLAGQIDAKVKSALA